MQQQRAEHTRHELIRLCHAGLDSRTLRVEIMKRLRTVIPMDESFFATVDPATLLFTGAVVDDVLARATPLFMENELLQDDVNKCAWMARSHTAAVNLGQATQGDLARSRRYREILAPLGLGDELRAVLVIGSACWGFMCAHRDHASPHFTAAEAAFLARLTPHFAEGLRTALLLENMAGAPVPEEPGIVLLDEDLSVAATTPAADRWLAEIAAADWPRQQHLPYAVSAVAGRLLALERDPGAQPELPPRVRLRTAAGQWLVLHAARLGGSKPAGQIAVIMEAAHPAEVAPLIVQAYDLSKREAEIMQSVARGLSTTEIAEAMHISPNTVQDHLKAIFEKVGVSSRRELVRQLYVQQHLPRMAGSGGLAANGWFRY